MAETDFGHSIHGATVALASDAPGDAAAAIARPSSYCGECGSWGAHGSRCVCCGYDFHADPIDAKPLD